MIVWPLLVLVLLLMVWLSFGPQWTPLFDRLAASPSRSLPVSPLSYDGGGFVIGERQMTFGTPNNNRAALEFTSDPSNRVILLSGPDAFILGPRTNPVDAGRRPEIDFVPEPGDRLSFTAQESIVGWPTPFDFRLPFGPTSWWKKYVYYRLLWEKPSGARLEMRWRYERQYLAARGWTNPEMRWNSRTGLLSFDIHPTSKRLAVDPAKEQVTRELGTLARSIPNSREKSARDLETSPLNG